MVRLSVDVAPGDYTLTLEPGFRLVRIAGGAAYPVDATLVSENWQNFWVSAGAEATAVFRFEIEGQWVALGGSFVPTTPGVPAGVGGTPGSTPSGPLEPSEPYGDSLISHDGWVDGANNVFGISARSETERARS